MESPVFTGCRDTLDSRSDNTCSYPDKSGAIIISLKVFSEALTPRECGNLDKRLACIPAQTGQATLS